MVRVKICGLTCVADALLAVEYGADALGFIFAESPRRVSPTQVAAIVAALPPYVCKVGVFVDHPVELVREIMTFCGLDFAQLHGKENEQYCATLFPRVIKALTISDASGLTSLARYQVAAYLLDLDKERSGNLASHWELARQATAYGLIILAGGLTPANIREAIAIAQPYAVDVSRGVESSTGKKDLHKMRDFLRAVKGADKAYYDPSYLRKEPFLGTSWESRGTVPVPSLKEQIS